tara:strand:+ start:7084 stop:7461 length:378 start_codon:yes stop_codon:yes gene_type:complete
MTDRIRQRLIKAAREKQTISYTQLNDECELGFDFNRPHDRDTIGDLLGEISEWEHEKDRPLLSSLVRHKSGKHEQGDGFYKLCEYLGYGDWQKLKNDQNFELKHINKCFSYWKDNAHYKDFKNDF